MMLWRNSLRNLKIVAWLFIITGAISVADVLYHLLWKRELDLLQILPLSLFIGIGLLRRRRIWRYIALASLGLTMGGFLMLIILIVLAPNAWVFRSSLYGYVIPRAVSAAVIVAVSLAWLALVIWEYWVLRQREVRRLFHPAD